MIYGKVPNFRVFSARTDLTVVHKLEAGERKEHFPDSCRFYWPSLLARPKKKKTKNKKNKAISLLFLDVFTSVNIT